MDVTRVELRRVVDPESKIRGWAMVEFNGGALKVHGYRLVDTKNGLKVFPPARWNQESKTYRPEVEHAPEIWTKVVYAVLDAWNRRRERELTEGGVI